MNEPRMFPRDKNEIIMDAVERFHLPKRTAKFLESILEGRVKEEGLVCCSSGCSVCNLTIIDTLAYIRKVFREEGLPENGTQTP